MVLGPAGESMNLRIALFDAAELAADAIIKDYRNEKEKKGEKKKGNKQSRWG